MSKLKIRTYLKALRLERWPRSLAILPGTFAVLLVYKTPLEKALTRENLFLLAGAFLLTWFISTINYIVNEIADAPFDVHHPTKKERPFVRKEVKASRLLLIAAGLLLITYLASLLFYGYRFQLALLLLLIAGILYNVKPVRLKDVPYLDSTVESANNPIRFLIGWYIIENAFPPVSLLIGWWSFGNFLMVGKRVAEKKFLTKEQSDSYRRSLSRCSLRGLFAYMIFNGLLLTATLLLFFREIGFHRGTWLLPFIVLYLAFFIRKSLQDRETAEEPEKLLKNPYFAVYSLFLLVLFALIYFMR